MTRRRSRNRTRLVIFLVIAGSATGIWMWQGKPTPLKSEHESDQNSAMKLVKTPDKTNQASTENKKAESKNIQQIDKTPENTPQQPQFATGNALTKAVNPATQPAAAPSENTDGPKEFEKALADLQSKNFIAARTTFNRALHAGLPENKMKEARAYLNQLAEKTVFSRGVIKNDPLTGYYTVVSGDNLAHIAKRHKTTADFLAMINNIPNKNLIRVGMRLKVIHGPFHASIDKSKHLLHLYLQNVYLKSFPVALGTNGSTPTGRWRVDNHQVNPEWVNPRTHKRWHADDPDNPIGEYWIGLEGIEGAAVGQIGYGIHGTIEPETIGQNVSMGCVRLADKDIELIFKLLLPGHSRVTIYP